MRAVILTVIGVAVTIYSWPEIKSYLASAQEAAIQSAAEMKRERSTASNETSSQYANVGWNEIAIPRGRHNHFIVDVAINGTPITFMIDSGASDIVLSSDDARRVGLGGHLRYDLRYQTANGIVRAAPVTLREVRIGQLALRSIPASVNEGEMGMSLLGMSFLSRLRGFEYNGNSLILRY